MENLEIMQSNTQVNPQVDRMLALVKEMAEICNYYKPLEEGLKAIVDNTQLVDITEFKGNIAGLGQELVKSKLQNLQDKASFNAILAQKDGEIEKLQSTLGELGGELAKAKLDLINVQKSIQVQPATT